MGCLTPPRALDPSDSHLSAQLSMTHHGHHVSQLMLVSTRHEGHLEILMELRNADPTGPIDPGGPEVVPVQENHLT